MGACGEALQSNGRCPSRLLMADAIHWCEIAISAWGEMLLSTLQNGTVGRYKGRGVGNVFEKKNKTQERVRRGDRRKRADVHSRQSQ